MAQDGRTPAQIIRAGCARVRRLVLSPDSWDTNEILFALDRMEAQAIESLRAMSQTEPDGPVNG